MLTLTIVYIVNPLHCFNNGIDELFMWSCLTPTAQATLDRFAEEIINADKNKVEPTWNLQTLDEASLAFNINRTLEEKNQITIPDHLLVKLNTQCDMINAKHANGTPACELCKKYLSTIFNEKGCENIEKISSPPSAFQKLLTWRINKALRKT